MADIDWSFPWGPDEYNAYHFSTEAVHGYPCEMLAPVRQQKSDGPPVVQVLAAAVDVKWLPNMARRKSSNFQSDYWR